MNTPYKYDIFLSHAVEDKGEIADMLAKELTARQVKTWYSGLKLKIGSSIMEEINNGLRDSRYGVLILSPTYFKKKWTLTELNGIFALENMTQKRILPIWHNIDEQDILSKFPILADRFALSSKKGVRYLADQIAELVHGEDDSTSSTFQSENIRSNGKHDLQQLVATDQFSSLFEQLFALLDKDSRTYNQVILLSAEFHNLKNKERSGVLSHQVIARQQASIRYRLTELISEEF